MTDIKFINSVLFNKRFAIPPEILRDRIMLLLAITAIFVWGENGKPTDEIAGYIYEAVDTSDFRHFTIKIEGQKEPVMTNDELQTLRENGRKVAVEFDNLTVMAYINQNKQSILDSFKADGVHLVEGHAL